MGGGGGLLRAVLLLGLLLFAMSAGGCGGLSNGSRLTLGSAGWDENVAVSNLTKALLEDELGYESVEIRTLDVTDSFKGVGSGDLAAFQDVWMPNHKDYLSGVEDDVELLDPWYEGTTRFGLAVPSYMDATSLEDLNRSEADMIFGIEPGAVIMQRIPKEVTPAYGLKQRLVESSTSGMLSELDARYKNREPFVFVAWSPHWMNQKYDFRYLEDPKGTLGGLDDSSELSTIVRKGLKDDDPVAYAFMKSLTLTEDQVNVLEERMNEASDPLEGAREWARDNPKLVRPWIEAARQAQNS